MLRELSNYLIKLLGGLNEEESSNLIDENRSLTEQLNAWREQVNNIQHEKNNVIQELQFERGRNDQLIQILSGNKEKREVNPEQDKDLHPIEILPMSWTRLKKDLEFRHRAKKGNSDAKVS